MERGHFHNISVFLFTNNSDFHCSYAPHRSILNEYFSTGCFTMISYCIYIRLVHTKAIIRANLTNTIQSKNEYSQMYILGKNNKSYFNKQEKIKKDLNFFYKI